MLLILDMGDAKAHGIAGNRFFVGTLSFDDPAVNDELASTFSILKHPAPGGAAFDRALTSEFSRLLTPSISFGAESTWVNRTGRGSRNATGFDTTHLSLKGLLFRDDPHETLISAGFAWGLPGLANQRLDARGSIEPGVFFGKGSREAVGGFRCRQIGPRHERKCLALI